MTPEAKLAALLAAAEAPQRDYAFEAEVARRVALRRAWLTVFALVPWAIVGAVLLWGLSRSIGPALATAGEALTPLGLTLTAAGAGAALALWLSRRFSPA